MAQYKLRFSSLDRDALKASFISYLQSTSEFQNFNFNASGISSLIDMLSYNAYYQALMANFQMNEVFLDTATKRQNVVSRATELGYTPHSKRAAKASLIVTVANVPGNPSTLILPAGSAFETTANNSSYTFVTLVPYSASVQYDSNNNTFYQFSIDVYEGILSQNTFILGTDPSVDIPNMDMDTTTLRVFVTLDITEYEFYPPSNFLSVNGTDKVYYVVEGFNAYKINFGDNTLGMQPPQGSQIRVQYLLTSGDGANGASVFNFASTIPGAPTAVVSVTTTSIASGGDVAEPIDSIKSNAVNNFATQDRAVTANDFKTLIINSSTNIKDVLVWGGQDNNPPIFGKVVACVLPRYGDSLTTDDKTNIATIVSAKAVPNIGIVFVQPTYLNVLVNTIITYDSNVITQSVFDLQSSVTSTIANYINTNLTKFGGRLRYSNLVTAIDRTDASILNNITEISLKMKYTPSLQQTSTISFSFNNAIDNINKTFSVKSTVFYVPGFASGVWIEDDTAGNLHLFYSKNGVKTYAGYNIGTIDYSTGNVYIPSIFITGIDGTTIDFVAMPSETDLQSLNSTIIRIDTQDITVTTQVN
jgi:hypothetical protein